MYISNYETKHETKRKLRHPIFIRFAKPTEAGAKKNAPGGRARFGFLVCRRLLLGVGFHGLVVGVLEQALQRVAHGQVDAGVLGRDRLQEPLVIQLDQGARAHHVAEGQVDHLLHARVVLADHDGNRLHRQGFADDGEVLGVLGGGHQAGQDVVVHHEGIGTAGLDQQEGVGVVLAEQFL